MLNDLFHEVRLFEKRASHDAIHGWLYLLGGQFLQSEGSMASIATGAREMLGEGAELILVL